MEQCMILGHFLGGAEKLSGRLGAGAASDAPTDTAERAGMDLPPGPATAEPVEPHIDEARRFVWNYLKFYSETEQDLILANWQRACDTGSQLSTATESLTPTGSVTP